MHRNLFFYKVAVTLFILLTHHAIAAQSSLPQIGLVLSGGAARGFAHIGTLKMLDSLQIPVDYIVGTSMGGIIGALYAMGYSGSEIEKMAHNMNWSELFTDKPPREYSPYLQKKDDGKFQIELGLEKFKPIVPGGLISGQKVSLLISCLTTPVGTITNFNDLPIPFRCIGVDLITGKEVVLKSGSLAKAMRATMSIPTVFSPVEWGDSLLIDGGVLNNFPADVAKQMGADILIGVNVGTPLKPKNELQSIISILDQTMIITDYVRQQTNMALCDVVVIPDLTGYTTADFEQQKVMEIINRGDVAAQKYKDQLIQLKEKYLTAANQFFDNDTTQNKRQYIHSIKINGSASITSDDFLKLLHCKPGDVYNAVFLKRKILKLQTIGRFEKLDVEILPITQDSVSLAFRVTARKKPVIFGISIEGNHSLPYLFIYRLLGLKPSDPFDKDKLNKRINEMYGLGYFEQIHYEIEHVRENYLQLKIQVKEKPLRKLRIGFRYDDEYKIVGNLGLQANNIPIPGIRGEMFFQFAGLFKFDWSLAYPSRGLNLPIFPYLQLGYKEIPQKLFNVVTGDKIVEYDDKSFHAGVGLGILVGDMGILSIEYNREYTDISPNYTGDDPSAFPSWTDELRMLKANFIIDALDDPIIPQKGFKTNMAFDASLSSLNSAVDYLQFQMKFDGYKTIFKKHTLRFAGFYTDFINNLPFYKYILKGGPESFVGVDYYQIMGNNFGYLRFDYRFRHKRDIFFKLIFNAGIYDTDEAWGVIARKPIYGAGLGVKLLSLIGPLELIVSRGSQSINRWKDFQTNIYFTAGYKF